MKNKYQINFSTNYRDQYRILTATKCTVHPDSLTPAFKASRCALAPLNDGKRDGWTLSNLPFHSDTNSPSKKRIIQFQMLITLHSKLFFNIIL